MTQLCSFPSVFTVVTLILLGYTTGITIKKPINWLSNIDSWEGLEDELDTNPGNVIVPEFSDNSRLLPAAAKANLVRFYLYNDFVTRFDPDEIIYDDRNSLISSRYKKDFPVKFFIHGFGHNGNCTFPQVIKDAYIVNGYKYNIIVVDWGALSMDADSLDPITGLANYKTAVDNTKIVGRRVGEFISFLYQNRFTSLGKVHIVGWSLGAHVSGYAGENVYQTWFTKIARLTALDPAGPLFQTGRIGRHVCDRDADFVDFIHTDMGQSGSIKSLGHANFFPNSGFPPQPGCIDKYFRTPSFLEKLSSALMGSCSHGTAWIYYLESMLRTKPYIQARRCFGYLAYETGLCAFRTLSTVGEYCQPGTQGDFYMDIKPKEVQHSYKC